MLIRSCQLHQQPAIQNEYGPQKNIDAGMELVLLSDEMNCRSLERQ